MLSLTLTLIFISTFILTTSLFPLLPTVSSPARHDVLLLHDVRRCGPVLSLRHADSTWYRLRSSGPGSHRGRLAVCEPPPWPQRAGCTAALIALLRSVFNSTSIAVGDKVSANASTPAMSLNR